ncbi:TetR family transcriptional regulator [Desulfoluna limicola]|uniref:TetR family transcriptional regulator n=1 Tax=Desulfoluna limicola TaxID=2810562 RepID=A0ABN6F0J1_9BACT|nr:TetR/AcrR family transcriptional regulator [Desulfoluna limicola]BCS95016.1 TetR family transcriptional regulator [Desulfoluna limicola]
MTQTSPKKRGGKPRNSEATRRSLIEAVGHVLAEKGFGGLGVNAVARQAGVDKVLIYRYFEGLPGLMKAFGQEGDFWPGLRELAGGDIDSFKQLPLEEKLIGLGRNFLKGIRARPLTQEIMAWETVHRNELTEVLETLRETQMIRFYEEFLEPEKTNIDLMAVNAIFGGGLSYLICRSRHIRWYNGVDLKDEEGWKRIEAAMEHIIKAAIQMK